MMNEKKMLAFIDDLITLLDKHKMTQDEAISGVLSVIVKSERKYSKDPSVLIRYVEEYWKQYDIQDKADPFKAFSSLTNKLTGLA